jgi:hypothetical protein
LRCVSENGATSPIDPGFPSSAHFESVLGFCGPANNADSSTYVSSRK